MNLISGTHHLCERREYAFMILREYTIIFHGIDGLVPRALAISYFFLLKCYYSSQKGREKKSNLSLFFIL